MGSRVSVVTVSLLGPSSGMKKPARGAGVVADQVFGRCRSVAASALEGFEHKITHGADVGLNAF